MPIHSGHSAYWYNPERDGAGLVREVLSDERAMLYRAAAYLLPLAAERLP